MTQRDIDALDFKADGAFNKLVKPTALSKAAAQFDKLSKGVAQFVARTETLVERVRAVDRKFVEVETMLERIDAIRAFVEDAALAAAQIRVAANTPRVATFDDLAKAIAARGALRLN
jgi:hypothetical protein